MSSDDDSFNEPDESGHMSDDSFNDEVVHDDDDGDDGFDSSPAHSAAAAASHTAGTPAPASASSSSSNGTQTRSTQLAFEVSARQGDYLIQDEAELRVSMNALTADVAGVLHLPPHLASMLLRTHNWNREKFVSQYFDGSDKLLEANGLQFMADDGEKGACLTCTREDSSSSSSSALPSSKTTVPAPASADSSVNSAVSSPSTTSRDSSASPPSTFNCPVCYDDFPLEATVALGCGHRFCHGCWGVYLSTAVADGKLCIISRCAGFKCPILVPDKTFENLTEPSVFARHQQYLVRSYVEDNRSMRWCPAAHCTKAVRMLNSALSSVKCSCGFAFCFKCGEENHAPVGCDQLSEWLQKCKNESETAHWIIANCFPAEDHQILTSRGFMYLSDALAHFEANAELGIACSIDGRLEYRNVSKSALTIDSGKHRHINMVGQQASAVDAKSTQTNRMSLCPTDNHRMFARVGPTTADGQWSEASPPDLRIHTAGDIFAQGENDSKAVAEFVAHCASGAPGVSSIDLPFMATLSLETQDQCDAFLELYGFWLGAGSLQAGATITLDASRVEEYSYLESLFSRLPLVCGEKDRGYFSSAAPQVDCILRRSYVISESSWVQYWETESMSHATSEIVPAAGHAESTQPFGSWVLTDCSRDHVRSIVRGLQLASGSEAGLIVTSSLRFRDTLQQLLLHAGYTSVFDARQTIEGRPCHWAVGYAEDATHALPRLSVTKECSEVEVDGTVWCVTVPTEEQLIIVRRVLATDEDGTVIDASRPIVVGNTKKCPKCSIRIEKNQGCNHMTCRGCKFEWCWTCNGDWQQHGNQTGGYYKCNRWDPKGDAKAADKGSAEEAKAELGRYLHYYQRYHNHDQAKRFAEKQKVQTEKRMASLHAQSGGDAAWIDFQFMEAATQQVLECRNVLKYTYVFAYYLEDGHEKRLFEYLQQQLEAANEHLSELSELPPLEKIDRAQVVNYTRITKQFMDGLISGVASGLTGAA